MQTAARAHARESDYNALRRIQKALHPRHHPDKNHVASTIMASLPVIVSYLPFDPDTEPDSGPRYSQLMSARKLDSVVTPIWSSIEDLGWPSGCDSRSEWHDRYIYATDYPRDLLDRIADTPARHDIRDLTEENDGQQSLIAHSAWEFGPFNLKFNRYERQCFSYGYNDRDRTYGPAVWSGSEVLAHRRDLPDPKPHVSATMSHAVSFGARPLRSELQCIVTLMKKQMKKRQWANHRLVPIFVYTFNGTCVRVTQAVFDNGRLQVRQSKGVDIRCENNDFTNLKLLVRWLLAEPCGNTRWDRVVNQDQMSIGFQPPSDDLLPEIVLGAS